MAQAVDYNLGPATFPRGWFIVAEASELDKGPMAVRFFGKDLALYRGESGKPVLLDAYCPHMGTHLTASTSCAIVKDGKQIEGDSIRCPYHGWRYGSDGQCDDIPYHEGPIPKSARLGSYPAVQSMGCIMAWHDPEGGEPEYEAPRLKEWDDPQWVQWELDHLGELDIHPQEVLDNMADVAHLGPTHGAPCEWFENEFRDHVYVQRQGGVLALYDCLLISTTWYTGPGLLLSKQVFGGAEIYELIANTPVDDGRIKVWHGALVKGANAVAADEDIAMAKGAQAGALEAFSADFGVWSHKRPALKIMQLKTDGPFNKGRTWYKQFYDSRENAANYHAELNGFHSVQDFPIPDDEARAIDVGLFDA